MNENEYRRLVIEYIEESSNVDNEVINYFFSENNKYILGSGRQAAVCLEICRNLKCNIEGIISDNSYDFSLRKGFWRDLINSTKVIKISEIPNKGNSQILMAISHADYASAREKLQLEGFKKENIYICNWNHNVDLRDICYYAYEKARYVM